MENNYDEENTVEIHYEKYLENLNNKENNELEEKSEIENKDYKFDNNDELEEKEAIIVNGSNKPKKKKNKTKIIIIIISILILLAGIGIGLYFLLAPVHKEANEIDNKKECEKFKYHWWDDKNICIENQTIEQINNEKDNDYKKSVCLEFNYYWWGKKNTCSKTEPKLEIVDEKSTTRPIAVMINNHAQARPYHSGLQDANIVYEIIVEGGITRMMAIFKDKTTARIGSVRSSRHYYLDYALENDAIYVHFGWSPQAENDIKKLGVNNINGLYDSGFERDLSLPVDYEHTAITSIDKIATTANNKGYRMNYNSENVYDEQVLKYSTDEIDLSGSEDSMIANSVIIPYSYYMTSSYKYDPEHKYYLRFANDVAHTDYVTKEQYHFKNIIVINVKNYSIDNYGRQTLDNIGTGTGYFITNGYARPITWEKSSRESKTIYKYQDGTEINVNDDNTFIQIEPITQTTTISE